MATDRSDGDFADSVDHSELDARCRDLVDLPWTMLTQVHGSRVVEVTEPGGCSGAEADGAVTALTGVVLAVRTADCAPVVLVGTDGHSRPVAVGIAHAGWKGLESGVLDHAVERLRALGSTHVEWYLGPCISAAEYEFGRPDLDRLVQRLGPSIESVTRTGSPALDLRAAVAAEMSRHGAIPKGEDPLCTASSAQYYSWRARQESGRQITAVWLENAGRSVPRRAVRRADGTTN